MKMVSESRNSTKKFPHIVLVHVQRLLPKQYKAKEIAKKLVIYSRMLKDWLNQGAFRQVKAFRVRALPPARKRTTVNSRLNKDKSFL
jgi:hypothetical protein